MSDEVIRLTAFVHGHVQGVGFRWFTRAKALELGLVGTATNLADGRVQVVAEGRLDRIEALVTWLRSGETPGRVDDVVEQRTPPRHDVRGFQER